MKRRLGKDRVDVLKRPIIVAEHTQRLGAFEPGGDVIGFQGNGSIVVRKGVGIVLLQPPDVAPGGVNQRIAGPSADRLFAFRQGLVVLALHVVKVRALEEELVIGLIEA